MAELNTLKNWPEPPEDYDYADDLSGPEEMCPVCGGDGMEDDVSPCPHCDGEGYEWWL